MKDPELTAWHIMAAIISNTELFRQAEDDQHREKKDKKEKVHGGSWISPKRNTRYRMLSYMQTMYKWYHICLFLMLFFEL